MTAQHERALQREILTRLRAGPRPVIALATPNGITGGPDIARIKAIMRANGMIIDGMPDLCLLWRGGCAAVELKRPASRDLLGHRKPAGVASDAQLAFADRCAAIGVTHAFVSSWDELDRLLDQWGVPRA